MKKQEFLRELKKRLSRLPRKDVEERINFYNVETYPPLRSAAARMFESRGDIIS